MMDMLVLASALAAATPASTTATTQDGASGATAAPGAFDLSGEISLMSDYRFRGVSRSNGDPAGQAGFTIRHESGLYAGARGTSLRGNDIYRLRNPGFGSQGDVQLDLYSGYSASLGGGFEADAGVMYYALAGGSGARDYAEPYASLSYLLGPVQATGGAKYAPSQAGTGHQAMLYLYGQIDLSVPFRPWTISAQAGHQDWGRYGGYWNWSLGANYHLRVAGLPGAELGLRYVDTNLPSTRGQDATLLASVALNF